MVELRSEQDHVSVHSKTKRSLETKMYEKKNNRRCKEEIYAMAKLESRICELKIDLGTV